MTEEEKLKIAEIVSDLADAVLTCSLAMSLAVRIAEMGKSDENPLRTNAQNFKALNNEVRKSLSSALAKVGELP